MMNLRTAHQINRYLKANGLPDPKTSDAKAFWDQISAIKGLEYPFKTNEARAAAEAHITAIGDVYVLMKHMTCWPELRTASMVDVLLKWIAAKASSGNAHIIRDAIDALPDVWKANKERFAEATRADGYTQGDYFDNVLARLKKDGDAEGIRYFLEAACHSVDVRTNTVRALFSRINEYGLPGEAAASLYLILEKRIREAAKEDAEKTKNRTAIDDYLTDREATWDAVVRFHDDPEGYRKALEDAQKEATAKRVQFTDLWRSQFKR